MRGVIPRQGWGRGGGSRLLYLVEHVVQLLLHVQQLLAVRVRASGGGGEGGSPGLDSDQMLKNILSSSCGYSK